MTTVGRQLILGPQRPDISLGRTMKQHSFDNGSVAVISAGWQEAEGDLDEIRQDIDLPMADLGIYERSNALFTREKALHNAYRDRQERLTELQQLYRARLKHHKAAVRQALRAEGTPSIIAAERRHAISQLRALDRHHERQIAKAHNRFDSEFNVTTNADLATQAAEVTEQLESAQTVIITGGNLLILINRLRLFGINELLAKKQIVAWSAGAMMLGDRIILFHDRMPQGIRDAEIIDSGLGLLPNILVLPDAKNRLRTGNSLRMRALSRRFAPATCHMLNNGSSALFENGAITAVQSVRFPDRDGRIATVRVQ